MKLKDLDAHGRILVTSEALTRVTRSGQATLMKATDPIFCWKYRATTLSLRSRARSSEWCTESGSTRLGPG